LNKKYLTITVIYAIFVFYLSVQPITEETPEWFPYQDKVFHVMLYAIFSFILAIGMRQGKKQYLVKTVFYMSFVISFIYGFFIEICQIFVPTRSFEVLDITANSIGSILGVTVAIFSLFIISKLEIKRNIPPI